MVQNHSPEKGKNRTRRVSRMPLSDLRPHYLHELFFDPPPDDKLDALAARLKQGLPLPGSVEVESDGTVLIGMPSVEAARRAGWAELEVVVRQDLEVFGDVPKELEIIDLHVERGGLSQLALVRCLAHAHAIGDEVPDRGRRDYQRGKLEDVVARHLGVGSRSAARHLSLVDLPRPIQQAFDAGRIRIGLAETVKNLSADAKEAIAAAIAAGANPAAVVTRYLPQKRARRKPYSVRISSYVKALNKALATAPERAPGIVYLTRGEQDVLRQVVATATQLLEGCHTIDAAQQQANCEALRAGRIGPASPTPLSSVPAEAH